MGLTVSGDLNYRKKLWNYDKKPSHILPGFIEATDVLVSDVNSCEITTGISVKNKKSPYEDQLRESFELLHKDFPNLKVSSSLVRNIINHSHHQIKGVLYSDGVHHTASEQDIYPLIDRIGGGDAFMSGLVYGLINYKDLPDKVINFATAASALKHTVEGDFSSFSDDEIMALLAGSNTKNVER